MTDTDSGSLEFIIIAEDLCDCGEQEMRDILLRIFLDNDIQHRNSSLSSIREMKLYVNRLVSMNSTTSCMESSAPSASIQRSTSNSTEDITKPKRKK